MDLTAIGTTAAIVSIIAGGIAILGFLGGVWVKLQKVIGSIDIFMQDWSGSEARPGRDKVPGVMERLNRIDGELKHNSGSTMKDAVKRIENKLQKIDERLEEGNEMFSSFEQRISNIEGKLDK